LRRPRSSALNRNQAALGQFRIKVEEKAMSAWFKDNTYQLLEDAKSIAWDYLDRSNEIDDPAEARQFLADRIEFMLGQGQRNKLLLSNRAIAAFREYRKARTIELALVSR
jgi:hypothetical protein